MPFLQFQVRRGTAAEWTSANPILSAGEMAVETDTNKFKIGNGTDDWVTLTYPTNAPMSPYVAWVEQIGSGYGSGPSFVAVSANGRKIVAARNGTLSLTTSTDGGASWAPRPTGSPNANWYGIASSADGTKLVATVLGGDIWTSTTSGETWTNRTTGTPLSGLGWRSIASSADGTKLVTLDETIGNIWTSTDSGVTWTNRTTGTPLEDNFGAATGVATSSDGVKLFVCVYTLGIYASTNSGVTWTQVKTDTLQWTSITSSADGTKLAATETYGGDVWTSTDSGATWVNRTGGGPYSGNAWQTIASSSNGTRLVAGAIGMGTNYVWTSADSGVTWTHSTTPSDWVGVASSSDGSMFVAVQNPGRVWTSFIGNAKSQYANSSYYALEDGEVLQLSYADACKVVYLDPATLVGTDGYASILLPPAAADPQANGHPSIFNISTTPPGATVGGTVYSQFIAISQAGPTQLIYNDTCLSCATSITAYTCGINGLPYLSFNSSFISVPACSRWNFSFKQGPPGTPRNGVCTSCLGTWAAWYRAHCASGCGTYPGGVGITGYI